MILYIKNIISLINFFLLGIFFGGRIKAARKNIMFYNSEKIGDIMVSSMILENDNLFPEDIEIFFLIKEKYLPLLKNYEGRIKIITYKYGMYKWFIPYRIFIIKRIRNLGVENFYNLTPARGMLNDEISLLSGANKIFALNNDKKYLEGIAGRIMDKYYDEILFSEIKNEYEKNEKLLKIITGKDKIKFENEKTLKISVSNNLIDTGMVVKGEYIVISPLSTDLERTWRINNFSRLCAELSKIYKVVLVGSPAEKILLEKIRNKNEDVIIDTSTLLNLPDIIYHCKIFIGGNSGLTHIALKLGKPLLAILDGGYYNRYFPYKSENKNNNYVYNMMDCFECGFDCIYEKKYCLENISFEDVNNKIKQILKN